MVLLNIHQGRETIRRSLATATVMASVLATSVGILITPTIVRASALPTSVLGTAGNVQITLTWTAPSSITFPTAPTGYVIQYSSNDGSTWTQLTSNANSTSTADRNDKLDQLENLWWV